VNSKLFVGLGLLILLCSGQVWSQEAPGLKSLSFPVIQYSLKNGLRVILSEDDSLPIVSVVMAYNAGSIYEQPGKTSLAYLVENLMFQGSENIAPMQHFSYIQRIGGLLNAATSYDKTLFYQTVPSNQLALVLWLESDRLRSLAISRGSLEKTKDALIEERRQRQASDLYFESYTLFDQLLFPDFAYGHPFIGTEEDLRNLAEDDVNTFYTAHYTPNNAVLCITGQIDIPRTKDFVSRYFETIPRGEEVSPVAPPTIPKAGPVIQTLKDTLASRPAFHLGFRIQSLQTGDYYTSKIMDYLLLRGKTSRLHRRLMKKERVAYYLSGGLEERKGGLVFKIFAINNNDVMTERSQKSILSEMNKLKTEYVSGAELEKAKVMFKTDYLMRVSTTLDKALFLCDIVFSQVQVTDLNAELNKYLRVSPTAVLSLAKRDLIPENMVLLNIKIK